MMDKRAARRAAFARIRSLGAETKASHSAAIIDHLRTAPAFLESEAVFSYLAMSSEPDLDGLVTTNPEKSWGFSRVAEDGHRLAFHRYDGPDSLMRGEFGFLEPDPRTSPELTLPDLVLVPGVGFSPENRARLGRGRGHYDRFLGPLRNKPNAPLVVGVCFSVQLMELDPEPHDVPMDALVTEKGWFPAVPKGEEK